MKRKRGIGRGNTGEMVGQSKKSRRENRQPDLGKKAQARTPPLAIGGLREKADSDGTKGVGGTRHGRNTRSIEQRSKGAKSNASLRARGDRRPSPIEHPSAALI